uniref:Uncharacterized protein n=1 Tax=Meloidogyne floridensis TaxID=298350 RepID=A0A915PBK7_9BILA
MPTRQQRKRAMRKEQHQRSVRPKSPLQDCGHPTNVQNAVQTNNEDVLTSDHARIVSPTQRGFIDIDSSDAQSEDLQILNDLSTCNTPLTPFSLTSESYVLTQHIKSREPSVDTESLISSIDSVSICSSRASSPTSNKRKVGRPKKQTRKSAGRKPKNLKQANPSNE